MNRHSRCGIISFVRVGWPNTNFLLLSTAFKHWAAGCRASTTRHAKEQDCDQTHAAPRPPSRVRQSTRNLEKDIVGASVARYPSAETHGESASGTQSLVSSLPLWRWLLPGPKLAALIRHHETDGKGESPGQVSIPNATCRVGAGCCPAPLPPIDRMKMYTASFRRWLLPIKNGSLLPLLVPHPRRLPLGI